MNARLYSAKRLLKQTGIIFVSIGDDELGNLVTLCKEIFGEENYIATCPRITKRTSNKGVFSKGLKENRLKAFKREYKKAYFMQYALSRLLLCSSTFR